MTRVRDLLADAERWATISACGRFRYRAGRRWAPGPLLLFIMLNPSTADAERDDATFRRCAGFAHAHGFGGFEVVNLYAYRATDPQDLRKAGWPVGPDNDDHIVAAVRSSAAVCVAWGSNAAGLSRPTVVLAMLRARGVDVQCLRVTRGGHPQHPLMLPSTCRLQPFAQVREAVAA